MPEGSGISQVVKEAEGRKDVDQTILHHVDQQPIPGDVPIERMSEPTEEQKIAYGSDQKIAYGADRYA